MERKSVLLTLIIILLIIITGFVAYNQYFNQSNNIRIDNVNFDMPEGFKVVDNNGSSDVKLLKGNTAIYMGVFNDTNIKNHVNDYAAYANQENCSVQISNFTIDDLMIYKSANNKTGSNHYWFVSDNKTYTIYNYGPYNKMDTTVFDLIKSMKFVE